MTQRSPSPRKRAAAPALPPAAKPDARETLHAQAGQCICGNLRMAARVVTSIYDAALRPCGIEANQMIMLWVCHEAGELIGGELARLAGMDQSTASRNVAVLESRGLVRCAASTGDRRERVVRLTPKGRATLVRALPRWQQVQRELAERTAAIGDIVRIGRHLRKATRILQSAEEPGKRRGERAAA